MTRSEERLHVGTESVPAGRARLRKYVVTENVTTTVPVSHEEVRLEREPITDANRDAPCPARTSPRKSTRSSLNAERPVVTKETVPVERVRLATETVAGEQQVSEEVRKEQIDDPEVDTDRPGPLSRCSAGAAALSPAAAPALTVQTITGQPNLPLEENPYA